MQNTGHETLLLSALLCAVSGIIVVEAVPSAHCTHYTLLNFRNARTSVTSGTAAEQGLSQPRCPPLSQIYDHGWSVMDVEIVDEVEILDEVEEEEEGRECEDTNKHEHARR
jgi:hypothetical protein